MLFGKNKQPAAGGKIDTIIGNGTHLDGTLNVEGTLRIDGSVNGEIKINGDVIVGKTGVVRASIKGRNVTVAGEVHGDITLDGKLEISNSGKVLGDIEVANLVISEGAFFKGKSTMYKEGRPAENDGFSAKKEQRKNEARKS